MTPQLTTAKPATPAPVAPRPRPDFTSQRAMVQASLDRVDYRREQRPRD